MGNFKGQIYGGDWESYEGMLQSSDLREWDWEKKKYVCKVIPDYLPKESEIVYACYNTGDDDGDATVVWRKGKKYFIGSDSHCSCNGLEYDQLFSGFETSLKALAMKKEFKNLPNTYYIKKLIDRALKKD